MGNVLQKSNEIVNIKDIKFIKSGRLAKSKMINDEKVCDTCKECKLISEFHTHVGCVGGVYPNCKECRRKLGKNWYAKSIGKSINQVRKGDKIIDGRKICSRCKQWQSINCFGRDVNKTCGLTSWCNKCDKLHSHMKNKILKMEFVIGYGGCCSCCGETRISLLTIEHIKNKGHDLIYYQTNGLINKLKELEWPDGYTVLCYNCNLSTRHGMPCIHSKEYTIFEEKFKLFLNNSSNKEKYYKLEQKLKTMNKRRE